MIFNIQYNLRKMILTSLASRSLSLISIELSINLDNNHLHEC